jgi:hypothetical protein
MRECLINWKGCGRKRSWRNVRNRLGICIGQRKKHKIVKVRTACLQREIWNYDLQNTKQHDNHSSTKFGRNKQNLGCPACSQWSYWGIRLQAHNEQECLLLYSLNKATGLHAKCALQNKYVMFLLVSSVSGGSTNEVTDLQETKLLRLFCLTNLHY